MNALRCPWHWHIIEGMADLVHDGAWALTFGGELPGEAVRDGRSIDGTAEYLDEIASQNPARITLYRAPGHRRWDGKVEMVSAPLANLPEECLLWQVDSDELWTTEQFTRLRDLFLQNPQRTSAVFSAISLSAPIWPSIAAVPIRRSNGAAPGDIGRG